jgi:hypothetical protein
VLRWAGRAMSHPVAELKKDMPRASASLRTMRVAFVQRVVRPITQPVLRVGERIVHPAWARTVTWSESPSRWFNKFGAKHKLPVEFKEAATPRARWRPTTAERVQRPFAPDKNAIAAQLARNAAARTISPPRPSRTATPPPPPKRK